MAPEMQCFVGLMSGTSLDGVDGVLLELPPPSAAASKTGPQLQGMRVLAHAHRPFEASLRQEFLALNRSGGSDELHRSAVAANRLAHLCHAIVGDLLERSGRTAGQVRAIGAHGQTVRHLPAPLHGSPTGYSLQLNNPALLAELCHIDVVADFRSRDIAAGGQGAPLVPAFHHALFSLPGTARAVLNLGGISNLTSLTAFGGVHGFDCGPANVLMDLWCERHTGQPFDKDGRWAAQGQVRAELLRRLLDEAYFELPPPKSTGRDLFHADWLAAKLAQHATPERPEDVQATLCELTALTCARAVEQHAPAAAELLVCGGGAFNRQLMSRLAQLLPALTVCATDSHGMPATQVEAAAFAWLAYAHLNRIPGNLPSVTGAAGPRILGALYPG